MVENAFPSPIISQNIFGDVHPATGSKIVKMRSRLKCFERQTFEDCRVFHLRPRLIDSFCWPHIFVANVAAS
jgi:hypothetical protein